MAALNVAAGYQRNRAGTCADCADRACVACRSRLQDAQSYDRIAAQMSGAARVPDSSHLDPRRLGEHDPDREVGQ
jgi:hypothetical protein